MSVPFWPTDMPQSMTTAISGGPQDGRVSFQPDYGPPIERKRTTGLVHTYTLDFGPITRTQLSAFESWFQNTVANGAKTFIMRDPFHDKPKWWRIASSDPVYQLQGVSETHVNLSFTGMMLPADPWFADYVEANTSRVPHVVADYVNSVFGVNGVKGTGSDVAAVSGVFDVYTYYTNGTMTEELNKTVNAGDIPATAPAGVDKILAFDP